MPSDLPLHAQCNPPHICFSAGKLAGQAGWLRRVRPQQSLCLGCAPVAAVHCADLATSHVFRLLLLAVHVEEYTSADPVLGKIHIALVFAGVDLCCRMPKTVSCLCRSWRFELCLLRLQAHHWLPRMVTGLAYCELAAPTCLPLPCMLCRLHEVVGTCLLQIPCKPAGDLLAGASGMSSHAH